MVWPQPGINAFGALRSFPAERRDTRTRGGVRTRVVTRDGDPDATDRVLARCVSAWERRHPTCLKKLCVRVDLGRDQQPLSRDILVAFG